MTSIPTSNFSVSSNVVWPRVARKIEHVSRAVGNPPQLRIVLERRELSGRRQLGHEVVAGRRGEHMKALGQGQRESQARGVPFTGFPTERFHATLYVVR